MKHAVSRLIEFAKNRRLSQEELDSKTLENSSDFKESFYLSPLGNSCSRIEAIHHYIKSVYNNTLTRKPAPGFNPRLYAKYHNLKTHHLDPFAHYIRHGRLNGPWQEEIFQPSETFKADPTQLQCALHIHAFHPDLLPNILDRLQSNHLKYDLFISVTSKDDEQAITPLLSTYTKGNVTVSIVPNKGRNIGPFLTEFNRELQNYDVIGHVHTKKTPQVKLRTAIDAWVNFLFENLIGGQHNMADQIITKFKQEPKLGIIYPDDPHLMGWTKNKAYAEELATQLGIDQLPEGDFSFPIGTMFWARPEALKPLFALKFDWNKYPTEPLSDDGSILHALERLLPLVVAKQKFKCAVIYTSGVTR